MTTARPRYPLNVSGLWLWNMEHVLKADHKRKTNFFSQKETEGWYPGTNGSEKEKEPNGTIRDIAKYRRLDDPYFRMRIIKMLYAMLNRR